VSQLCDKVVIINRGSIAVEGSLAELTAEMSLEEVFLKYISSDEPSLPRFEPQEAGA
jgi:ABC-type Na+ transport system ATPase subunit NatA